MKEVKKSLEVAKLLSEVAMLLKQSMTKGFEEFGITAPQGMVIGTLSRFGKMKISELSDKLSLSNSTISGIVDRLENQEIVERIRSKEDRRVVYVSLSPKFEEMHNGFHRRAEEKIEKIMSKGTPEDLNKIMDGLNTLKRLLSD
ncbi:hypothetical protein CPJCM30710_01980 [Clostridium polyendosporum]|uniref:HTH marR-type domain-containing protein n=1 Tax=Clostridium polyendosporum TaxID=69208 RepID=A0A919RWE2_9CLOT|nr:MarR family transcriptional regulator [Clostridium polyendosporum]GIM27532.1 hypothetical protein CPJCM30710_01980 [Clostridium polyendosporum]